MSSHLPGHCMLSARITSPCVNVTVYTSMYCHEGPGSTPAHQPVTVISVRNIRVIEYTFKRNAMLVETIPEQCYRPLAWKSANVALTSSSNCGSLGDRTYLIPQEGTKDKESSSSDPNFGDASTDTKDGQLDGIDGSLIDSVAIWPMRTIRTLVDRMLEKSWYSIAKTSSNCGEA
ncbi:hypothetical protein OBBRIDRAFT_829663 [Obba rivulosa]|uniref:Uncharacterized protein n=1 Tax=Obba rivulosa TaxID=1052685 RepID=A0A8E2AH54_9APHY|nr:hypothetical protein OBBRIDRAFT_829663 [Obba rivulosa]